MSNAVYAEGMGFFHKGSGGKGVAPGDACLSPPPPPGGPMPVPYVNMLQASDLAQGSKTVKIMGEPTALEKVSYVSTSSGDEGGTQGGGVVTHKTKGKGQFQSWSFVVKVEGKGVVCNGHTAGQNAGSVPPNCVDSTLLVNFLAGLSTQELKKDCADYVYDDHYTPATPKQKSGLRNPQQRCWECSKGMSEEPRQRAVI